MKGTNFDLLARVGFFIRVVIPAPIDKIGKGTGLEVWCAHTHLKNERWREINETNLKIIAIRTV